MITGAYSVFECNEHVFARYLEAFYIAMDDRKILSLLYSGLRNTIPTSRFLGVKPPVPPLPEQTAIVRFLDHTDRRIRRYICAKQKLIALLEEQKQAIIHQAVTGQPYSVYKPSGVEWLRKIPEHWEVRRLRYLIEGKLTYGANAAAEYTDPTWPRYLRITDFSKNGELRKDIFRSLLPEMAKDYLVKPGDILLARSRATVGKALTCGRTKSSMN